MRSFGIARVVAYMVFLATVTVTAAFAMKHEATAEKGRALFNNPKLGTTGRSCNDCHMNGAGLEKAGEKTDLDRIVNNCITRALKGKALKAKSVKMQSLMLYLKGLGKDGRDKAATGKRTPVGC